MKKYYTEDDPNGFAVIYADTQPTGFTEVTDYDELLKLHMNRYEQCRKDGINFHNTFRTRLFLEIKLGNITPAEAFEVESHLSVLKDNLISGDWLTAGNTNTNLALLGVYDQALKDEVQAGIDAYINENY